MMYELESVQENETSLGFWDTNTVHLISARRPGQMVVKKKKKRNGRIMDFGVPTDHRVKMKESEKEISIKTLLENWKKL